MDDSWDIGNVLSYLSWSEKTWIIFISKAQSLALFQQTSPWTMSGVGVKKRNFLNAASYQLITAKRAKGLGLDVRVFKNFFSIKKPKKFACATWVWDDLIFCYSTLTIGNFYRSQETHLLLTIKFNFQLLSIDCHPKVVLKGGKKDREGIIWAANIDCILVPVCDVLNNNYARVVCKQLGYSGGIAMKSKLE